MSSFNISLCSIEQDSLYALMQVSSVSQRITKSSAYLTRLKPFSFKYKSKGDKYIFDSNGDNALPCGIPLFISLNLSLLSSLINSSTFATSWFSPDIIKSFSEESVRFGSMVLFISSFLFTVPKKSIKSASRTNLLPSL